MGELGFAKLSRMRLGTPAFNSVNKSVNLGTRDALRIDLALKMRNYDIICPMTYLKIVGQL